jgi:hypothetical protein
MQVLNSSNSEAISEVFVLRKSIKDKIILSQPFILSSHLVVHGEPPNGSVSDYKVIGEQ